MTYRFLALLFVILIVTNLIYLVHSSKHPLRPIQNYTNNQQQNRGLSDKKSIHLLVNYEVLCPDSERFIVEKLAKSVLIFRDKLNVQLIPYGKATYKSNQATRLYDFQCQHGPKECFGNMIHSCAIYLYPTMSKHFGFIYCTMSKFIYRSNQMEQVVNECSNGMVSGRKVLECANSNFGNKLLYSMGAYTSNMRPRVSYVPWLVVDGVYSEQVQYEAEHNLAGYLCRKFKELNNQINMFAC